jgi:hypothetical protein
MGKKLPVIVVEGVREGVVYEAEAKGCVLYLWSPLKAEMVAPKEK